MIRTLGAWRFDPAERLGGGGYAQAYLCLNPARHPQQCAIKIFDDPYYANTFERELAALQVVRGCPGTLAIVDHGRDATGRLCIVTELVPGTRLDKLIRKSGAINELQLRMILEQLLPVLQHAHSHGWLHKDIKASNILFDGSSATLIDWGVAEPVGDGRAESIRAKQDYVAPECFAGRHGIATDFYSLGWFIVEALTGARPYHFSTNRERDYRVAAHCLEHPEPPESLPDAWRPLVLAWIARNPAQRLVGYELESLLARAAAHVTTDINDSVAHNDLGRQFGYLEQVAHAGVPYAQHKMALRQLEAGHHAEALHWLECAAASGYATAAFRLARILSKGEICAAAPEWAQELLEAAAGAGNSAARYRLARQLFETGQTDEALSWLKQAADAGYARAQYEYARRVETGADDLAVVVTYLGMAADRGHANAQAHLMHLKSRHPDLPELVSVWPFWEHFAPPPAPLDLEVS
ncbi:MAG: protein kinase [Pseudomonadota bacterium]